MRRRPGYRRPCFGQRIAAAVRLPDPARQEPPVANHRVRALAKLPPLAGQPAVDKIVFAEPATAPAIGRRVPARLTTARVST
jgi:hypothetical protein